MLKNILSYTVKKFLFQNTFQSELINYKNIAYSLMDWAAAKKRYSLKTVSMTVIDQTPKLLQIWK